MESRSDEPDTPSGALIAAELESRSTGQPRTTARQRILRSLFVVVLVFVSVVGWSIGTALAAPGSDSVSARLAEWSRDHGLGGVVTWLEQWQYAHSQPRIGGSPPAGGIQGFRLYPAEHAPPTHHLLPSSREGYAWYARG
jgi:hypothetical protein